MPEGTSQRRRTTRRTDPEGAAERAAEAASETAAAAATPAATEPADPTPAGAPDAGAKAEVGAVTFPKGMLVTRAWELLGASPAVVRGVLTEAPDPISVADARQRVESFLRSPVVPTTEEA